MSNIIPILESAPENIRIASEKVAEKEGDLKTAKNALSVAIAKATMKHSEAKNQKLLDALVTQDEEVQIATIAVIKADGEYKKANIALEYEENKFVSARKIGGLDERVLHSITGANIA